jgi:hypothetical protein
MIKIENIHMHIFLFKKWLVVLMLALPTPNVAISLNLATFV